MGYFNIIDSLKNSRIEEGMMTSISKNSSSIDTDKLLKVLLDFDIQSLPRKNIKSNLSFYNKSPFSKIDSVVKSDMLPAVKRRTYYIYHLVDGNKHYIMISASSYNVLSGLSRCFIYEALDESVVDYIWDLVDKNKLSVDIKHLGSGLRDCKIVADTYYVFGSKLLSGVYGTLDDMRILKDTEDVLDLLFRSSIKLIEGGYNGLYRADIKGIVSSCVDCGITLVDDTLSFMLDFDDTEHCKEAYIKFNKNLTGKSSLYTFYKLGTKQIAFDFYI
jgi:hypothetical protein|nr:MAG TPA: hypothetical protein [Bacteriophage sp.]